MAHMGVNHFFFLHKIPSLNNNRVNAKRSNLIESCYLALAVLSQFIK